MSPEIIRAALGRYLGERVKAEKGVISEAMDFDDASSKLGGAGNARWHLVFGWDGYDSYEDGDLGELNTIAWSGYYVIVERAKGLTLKAAADVPELERLVGKVIAWLKALHFQDKDGNVACFEFKRSGWERVHSDEGWRRHEIQVRLLTALSAAEPVTVAL